LATCLPCTEIEWHRVVLAWAHPFDALAATTSTTTQHTRVADWRCSVLVLWTPCSALSPPRGRPVNYWHCCRMCLCFTWTTLILLTKLVCIKQN
jgi:hypothetical protein